MRSHNQGRFLTGAVRLGVFHRMRDDPNPDREGGASFTSDTPMADARRSDQDRFLTGAALVGGRFLTGAVLLGALPDGRGSVRRIRMGLADSESPR